MEGSGCYRNGSEVVRGMLDNRGECTIAGTALEASMPRNCGGMVLDSEGLICKILYLGSEWRRCLTAQHRTLEIGQNLISNAQTSIGKATIAIAPPGNSEPQLGFLQ